MALNQLFMPQGCFDTEIAIRSPATAVRVVAWVYESTVCDVFESKGGEDQNGNGRHGGEDQDEAYAEPTGPGRIKNRTLPLSSKLKNSAGFSEIWWIGVHQIQKSMNFGFQIWFFWKIKTNQEKYVKKN
jgi:hypothetical protein